MTRNTMFSDPAGSVIEFPWSFNRYIPGADLHFYNGHKR
jgi:hypothetical protein